MDEVDLYRMQEDEGIGQQIAANLQAILDNFSADDVAGLYRNIYKYTTCGPWLSVGLHQGGQVHCGELRGVKVGDVRKLIVGSIVEGCDQDADTFELDLLDYETPEAAVAAFGKAVEDVNESANAIWNDTHGCETCAAHFGINLDEQQCPVWTECPDCGGDGVVI